MHQVLIHIR